MRNRTYGGVRGWKTKVGRKLLRFPPTRLAHLEYRAIDCKLLFAVEELTAIALIVGESALASLLIVCLRDTVRRPYLLRLFLGLQARICIFDSRQKLV